MAKQLDSNNAESIASHAMDCNENDSLINWNNEAISFRWMPLRRLKNSLVEAIFSAGWLPTKQNMKMLEWDSLHGIRW